MKLEPGGCNCSDCVYGHIPGSSFVRFSGVTRVGDTCGGNWGCHPSIFFLKNLATSFSSRQFCGVTPGFFFSKTDDLFLLIAVTITIAFYCFHSGVTPSRVSPTPFLPVRPRFSTILCKFAHNKFFPSGVTPLEGVTWGGPPPPRH